MRKALADIAVPETGTLAPQHGKNAYDYSHVLDASHQEALPGAKVVVNFVPSHYEDCEEKHGWITATLHDGKDSKLGSIHGDIYPTDPDGRKFLGISSADVRGAPRELPDGRRLYWGRKLYEAIMGHSKNALGVTHIGGGSHSTYASLAHRWLAERHGMNYDPTPNTHDNQPLADPVAAEFGFGKPYSDNSWGEANQAPESMDDRFGPYAYTLKSELNKAEDLSTVPVGAEVEGESPPNVPGFFRTRAPGSFYDYDHLLNPDQKEKGYHIEVRTHLNSNNAGPVYARVYKRGMNPVDHAAIIEGYHHSDGEVAICFSKADKAHRDMKLGRAAYEALFAHSKNHLKAKQVTGDGHSTAADIAHKALATKYGLTWLKTPSSVAPDRTPDHNPGSFDYALSPYALKLHEAVTSGPIDIPLAKEEDETDPIIARLVHMRNNFYNESHEIPLILRETGFEVKHLAAAMRLLSSRSGGVTKEIVQCPLFLAKGKEAFEAAFPEADVGNAAQNESRREILTSLVDAGSANNFNVDNPTWVGDQIIHQYRKDGPENVYVHTNQRNLLHFGARACQHLREDQLAAVPLDVSHTSLYSPRQGFVKAMAARFTADGNWPEALKTKLLEYSKDLLSRFEKSKGLHRQPGSQTLAEVNEVLPIFKQVVATGLPPAIAKSRLTKGLFHSLLATHAPDYPEAKRKVLLEHFTNPDNIGKASNTQAAAMMAGMWLSSPHLSDDQFNNIVANYSDHLPLRELVQSPRFNETLAKKILEESSDTDVLYAMAEANKLTPEFFGEAARATLGNPQKKIDAQQATLAAARMSMKPNRDVAYRDGGYYEDNGVLKDRNGSVHPAYLTNPYSFSDKFGALLDIAARVRLHNPTATIPTSMFTDYLDRLEKHLSWRPELPQSSWTPPASPRSVVGMDDYTAKNYEGMPFEWRQGLAQTGVVAPEIDDALTDFAVKRYPRRITGAVERFLSGVQSPMAIENLLRNSSSAHAIRELLSRGDARPEWLSTVESRPEFTAVPGPEDLRFAHHQRFNNNYGYLHSGVDFHNALRRAVTESPAFPPERIASMITSATTPSHIQTFIGHDKWDASHSSQVLNMVPTIYGNALTDEIGRTKYDAKGDVRRAVISQGTVPWDKEGQTDLIRTIISYHGSRMTPEDWNAVDSGGYLDAATGNVDLINNALEAPTLPSNLLTKIYTQASALNPADHSQAYRYRSAAIKHANADPGLVATAIDNADLTKDGFTEYAELLENKGLSPALINKMIEKVRAYYPEVPIDVRGPRFANSHSFYSRLASSPLAPEEWLRSVHEQIQQRSLSGAELNSDFRFKDTTLASRVKTALGQLDPDIKYAFFPKVASRVGTAIWRKLRDVIESVGGKIHIGEVQKDPVFGKLPIDKARISRQMTPEEYEKKFEKVPVAKRPPPTINTKTDFLSSENVQKIIDSSPLAPALNVSYRLWHSSLQAHAYHMGQIDDMFQFNVTTDHIKKFKEAGLLPFWLELSARMRSQFGAHQLNPETIGWIRHNKLTPGNTIHVTEMQSDIRPLAGSWKETVKGIKERGWGSKSNPAQAVRFAMSTNWSTGERGAFPADKLDKLNEIVWGKNNDPDEVMLESLHEKLRSEGHHNVTIHMSGIGMAGALRHGDNHSQVPVEVRPTLKGPLPPNNPHGIAPEAVHMIEAYEDIPKKMGYDMDAAKYGDESTQVAEHYKGWPYHTSPVRKFEELTKGIERLPGLPFSHSFGGDRIFDASHYLTPEHKRLGYSLRIRVGEGPYGPFSIADVHHGTSNIIGGASLYVNDAGVRDGEKRKYGQFDFVKLKDQHIGKKLGLPIYEALLASAKGHWGCTHVRGLQHSSMAHSVHKQLADKHGLKYEAAPNYPSVKYATKEEWSEAPKAAMDAKWGPYSYTL